LSLHREENCFLKYVNGNGLKNKQIDENVFICPQEPYRAVHLDRDLVPLFCVEEKFSLTAHWCLQGTLLYILGEGGPGV
jgi:hypothetical protein